MIRISQIKLTAAQSGNEMKLLSQKVCEILHIKAEQLQKIEIIKKSMDARKKPKLFYIYSVDATVLNEAEILKKNKNASVTKSCAISYQFRGPQCKKMKEDDSRPVIIGMGPAGLFCAYLLAENGYCPIVLERGKCVEEREKDVEKFWNTGKLDPDSNVLFGEGGAGTFSDGKLNTLNKDPLGRNKKVLELFVKHGAPEQILYESKPHIGTDLLKKVLVSIRKEILSMGAEIRYNSQVTDLLVEDGRVTGVMINNHEILHAQNVVLAIGHSARDTFDMLYQRKVFIEPKAFAVGLRVLHPQRLINENQYGKENQDVYLEPAAYKLTAKTSSGRGVYSFCMCPGGYVVNASSEENRLAVNGMSYSSRASENANSAIIITVTPEDFHAEHPLAGIMFQRELEKKAYLLGNGKIPAQYYKDFTGKSGNTKYIQKPFEPLTKGAYQFCAVDEILPNELNQALIEGMTQFNRMIPGFADDYTVLMGVESRTSSPVRILRNEQFHSQNTQGLYPCGEGAGYAGGIMSAAMDGICVAEAIAVQTKIS